MQTPNTSMRILCLWLPDWPVQRREAVHPKLEQSVLLVTEATSRGEMVRHANGLAQTRGVRSSMPVTEARSFALRQDTVVIEPLHPEAETEALVALAAECEAHSFRVGLDEDDPPSGLLMDVTGVAHFFGGERFLAADLRRRLVRRRWKGRIAIAGSVGAAWAAAHFLPPVVLPTPWEPVILSEGDGERLSSLPAEGLRLDERSLAKLRRLGLKTIASVLALDRSTIPARFGQDFLQRVDQFTGARPELITPCRPAPRFLVTRRLEAGLIQREAIEQFGTMLLGELLDTLRARQLGSRCLTCRFLLEDRSTREVGLRLCHPTDHVPQVRALLRLQLERLAWEFPVVGMHIEALEVGPLDTRQREFFDGGTRDRDRQLRTLLDRLGNRLGEQAVLRVSVGADPVPERTLRFWPAVKEAPPNVHTHRRELWPLDRPTTFYPRPRRVEVVAAFPDGPPAVLQWYGTRFEVARHWGPERIESGWWEGPEIRRDYYRVETTEGRRWWLFRQISNGRWYLHGEFQ